MMNKNDLLKMARHVSYRGRGIPDRRMLHSEREWAIGILIFLLIALVGSFFTARLYVHYSSIESLASVDLGDRLERSDLSFIEEASRLYSEREKRFEEIASHNVLILDATTTESATSTSDVTEEGEGITGTSTPSDSE